MNTIELRQAIQKIKSEQSSLGKAIRHLKAARKGGWTNYHHLRSLQSLQATFRHRHVAWSIVRGRKLEQVDGGHDLNMKAVSKYVEEFRKRLGAQVDTSGDRLYVLVRGDLEPDYQAVQAGHAVAQWCLKHQWAKQGEKWENNTLIYLNVRDSEDLLSWANCLRKQGMRPIIFWEPDLNNQCTALAVCASPLCGNLLFKKLPLL